MVRAWVVSGRRTWITMALATAYILYALSCIGLIVFASVTAAGGLTPILCLDKRHSCHFRHICIQR